MYMYRLSNALRINLSKFRCRCNNLPIARQYKEGQQCDMICRLCNMNSIGDEYHYIFICPYFITERIKHLKPYYRNSPSMFKFEQLFQSLKLKELSSLAKFTGAIMNACKQIVIS